MYVECRFFKASFLIFIPW